jgi:hypothetical protein
MSQPNTPIHERVKLGWTEAPIDPRTLKLSAYVTPDLPAPPATLDWMSNASKWPMFRNDRCGDCVPAAFGHLVGAWTTYADGKTVLLTDADIITAYSGISGYNPRTGANDNGCISNKALNFWRRTGVGGHKIAAYVNINARDKTAVKAAANLFGGIYIAAQLPLAASTQFDRRQTWTPTSGANGRKGSWGGHGIHMGRYDADGFTVSTWGRLQKASWAWWDRYVVEAWGIASADWIAAQAGTNPLGFDLVKMLDDLDNIAPLNPTR